MKMSSVSQENMETYKESMMTRKEFEGIVEEVKTNKELAERLAQIEEPVDIEGYTEDFVEAVKTLNSYTEILEVIRSWDLVDKLREYQGLFLSGYTFKDEYLTTPIPLVLVGLDKERTLLKYPDKWYEDHREELSKTLDLLIYRKKNEGESYTERNSNIEDLDRFISDNNLSGYPKVFSYMLMRSTDGRYANDGDKIKVLPKFQKYISKKFDKKIKELNGDLVKISYSNMVKDYFGLDLDESKNAPKLSKQLKKAGISYTDEEIRHFGEVRNWWDDWNIFNKSTIRNKVFRARDLWVDKADFTIPVIVDDWAFNDSCNKSDSGAGADTHLVLRSFGFEYLKGYSVGYTRSNGYALYPAMRTYFLRKESDIAHAGTYADFSSTRAKACYEFTTVLLCIFFNKKVDDFYKIKGMNIDCQYYNDKKGGRIYFWANQAKNDYAKFGTAELFEEYDALEMGDYINNNESLRNTLNNYLKSNEYISLQEKYMNFRGLQLSDKAPEVRELSPLTKELLELI